MHWGNCTHAAVKSADFGQVVHLQAKRALTDSEKLFMHHIFVHMHKVHEECVTRRSIVLHCLHCVHVLEEEVTCFQFLLANKGNSRQVGLRNMIA